MILLDVDAENYSDVCEVVAEAMASEGHNSSNTKKIMQILQLRHKYAVKTGY